MEENKSLQLKLRKNESHLVSAGTGIVLLCVWSVIKSLILLTGQTGFHQETVTLENFTAGEKVAYYVCLILITAFIMLLQLKVGRGAVNEGRNGKKSRYLGLAILMLLVEISVIVFLILAYVKFPAQIFSTEDIIRQIAALIIDLTYMYLLMILIISATRLRRMRHGLNN